VSRKQACASRHWGDVITAIDNQKVASQLDVNLVLNHKRPGDSVTVTV